MLRVHDAAQKNFVVAFCRVFVGMLGQAQMQGDCREEREVGLILHMFLRVSLGHLMCMRVSGVGFITLYTFF